VKKCILTVALLTMLVAVVSAQTPKFGVGAFAGISVPVVQKDQASGSDFGFRARIKALPFLVVEPTLEFVKWGKPGVVQGVDLGIDGSKVTKFGIDVTLGGLPGAVGFKPFFVLGAASYKVKNSQTGFDESHLGYSGGMGFGIGIMTKIDIDVRATVVIIPTSGSGSKKAANIAAGLNYNFAL
jgi:hypothetical protein